MVKKGCKFGVILVLLFLTFGCSGKEKTPAGSAPDSGQKAAGSAAVKPAGGASGVSVAIMPKEPTAGDDLYLVFSGADAIGHCSWERNGEPIKTADPLRLPKGNFVKGDQIQVRVSINGQEASAGVKIVNAPPEVVAVPFKDPHIHRGVDIEVVPQGKDIDGDPVQFHYIWTLNGEKLTLDSPVLPGDQFQKGDHISLTVIPDDGESEGRAYRGREFVIPDAPPNFTSTPPLHFKSGVYRYQAAAEDPDGDAVHFSLESAPKGMSIDGDTGLVVWPIGQNQAGKHSITIVAEDDEGAKAFQTYTVTISLKD